MISRYLFLSLYQARGCGLGLSTSGSLSPTSALRLSAASISISASQLEKQTRRSHCRPPNQALHFNRTRTFKSEMSALLCALSPRCFVRASPPESPALNPLLQYSVCRAGIICPLCPSHCHSLPLEHSVWHAECAQQMFAEESDVLGLRAVPGIAREEKAQRHVLVRDTIRTLHSDAQKQRACWVPGGRWLEWSPD